jgi:hypothetical protein
MPEARSLQLARDPFAFGLQRMRRPVAVVLKRRRSSPPRPGRRPAGERVRALMNREPPLERSRRAQSIDSRSACASAPDDGGTGQAVLVDRQLGFIELRAQRAAASLSRRIAPTVRACAGASRNAATYGPLDVGGKRPRIRQVVGSLYRSDEETIEEPVCDLGRAYTAAQAQTA